MDFCCPYSTNGTVINKLKVVKKQTCPLQTGDVIYLVYRKNEPEHSKGGAVSGLDSRVVQQGPATAGKHCGKRLLKQAFPEGMLVLAASPFSFMYILGVGSVC